MDLPEEFKAKQLAYDYWLESSYKGKMQKFKDDLDQKIICQQEYLDKVAALEKENAEKQFQQLEDYSRVATTMMDAVSSLYEASKNRELTAARVNQFSAGKYPDLGGSQATNDEMIGLLKANLQMMREVRDAHKRPAVVSFQSIRERQEEFGQIKRKSTIY